MWAGIMPGIVVFELLAGPLVLSSLVLTAVENEGKRRDGNEEDAKPSAVEDASEPTWERVVFHPESVTGEHLWNLSYPG